MLTILGCMTVSLAVQTNWNGDLIWSEADQIGQYHSYGPMYPVIKIECSDKDDHGEKTVDLMDIEEHGTHEKWLKDGLDIKALEAEISKERQEDSDNSDNGSGFAFRISEAGVRRVIDYYNLKKQQELGFNHTLFERPGKVIAKHKCDKDSNTLKYYSNWGYDLATCTKSGHQSEYCEQCGKLYTNQEVPASGHNIVTEVITPATCTEPGEQISYCANPWCREEETVGSKLNPKHEVIPATGHRFSFEAAVNVPNGKYDGIHVHWSKDKFAERCNYCGKWRMGNSNALGINTQCGYCSGNSGDSNSSSINEDIWATWEWVEADAEGAEPRPPISKQSNELESKTPNATENPEVPTDTDASLTPGASVVAAFRSTSSGGYRAAAIAGDTIALSQDLADDGDGNYTFKGYTFRETGVAYDPYDPSWNDEKTAWAFSSGDGNTSNSLIIKVISADYTVTWYDVDTDEIIKGPEGRQAQYPDEQTSVDVAVKEDDKKLDGYEFVADCEKNKLEDTVTKDGDPVELKLYFKKQEPKLTYTVTYKWGGLPDGHGQIPPTDNKKYEENADVTVDKTFPKGEEVEVNGKTYVFSGWDRTDFKMPAEDVVIKGTWTEKTTPPPIVTIYNLAINYLEAGTRNVLQTAFTASLRAGDTYNQASPTISGYTLVDIAQAVVSGAMPASDVTVDVFYAPAHTLTINYVDRETGEAVAPVHTETLKEGDSYEQTSPVVEGYVLADVTQSTISGTMPAESVVVTVYYVRVPQTATYTIRHMYYRNNDVLEGDVTRRYTGTVGEIIRFTSDMREPSYDGRYYDYQGYLSSTDSFELTADDARGAGQGFTLVYSRSTGGGGYTPDPTPDPKPVTPDPEPEPEPEPVIPEPEPVTPEPEPEPVTPEPEPVTPEPEPEPQPEPTPTLPDPNDPDSPVEITIEEDGVPKTYIKVWDPENEEYVYILDEDVPLADQTPKTGDDSRTALWAALAGVSLAGAAAFTFAEKKRKNR